MFMNVLLKKDIVHNKLIWRMSVDIIYMYIHTYVCTTNLKFLEFPHPNIK